MPKRELLIDDLPAPGEPLTEHIDERNQAILSEELAARAEMLRGKLTRRERWQLERRYRALHRRLNRAKYNYLVKRRWLVWQRYQAARAAYQEAAGKKRAWLKREGVRLLQLGKSLDQQLRELRPLAREFEDVAGRLKTHERVMAFEAEERENQRAFAREARVWEAQIRAVFRQSKRLHHAGENSKGEPFVVTPEIEQVVFKSDRVYYKIRLMTQNWFERMFDRWRSALPYNVDIRDLTCDETLANLSAACNRVVTVERSKRGTSLFYVISRQDSPDGIPHKTLFSKAIEWYPREIHSKTPWIAGVTNDRVVEFYTFEDIPHILIAGSTQSGKSNHLNQMIATFVTMNSPAELRLLLVDNKGGIEFTHWRGIRHELEPMVKTASEVLPALQRVRQIMEKRLSQFEQARVKNLAAYNQRMPIDQRIPRIIVIIDEMATLVGLGDLTSAIHAELRVLSSQGRAVGVHCIVCTQHATVDVLPGWVKTNMVMRIAGKMPSQSASMVVLDSISAATLPNLPGRLVFSQGRFEVIAQSPYITDEEIARAVVISQSYPEAESPGERLPVLLPAADQQPVTEEEIIDIAIHHLEGTLSANAIHELIGGNAVISLRNLRRIVADIIERGEFEHEGAAYKIKKHRTAYIAVEHEIEAQRNENSVPLTVPLEKVS
jgi:hypothetical protein